MRLSRFIYLFIYLLPPPGGYAIESVYLFICLFIHLFIHLFIYLFIYSFIYSFIHLFIYSFIYYLRQEVIRLSRFIY